MSTTTARSSGGAARVPSGRFGRALSFDGVDDRVNVPDAAAFDLPSGVDARGVGPADARSATPATVVDEGAAGQLQLRPVRRHRGERARRRPSSPPRRSSAPGAAPLGLGTWTHLAQTWDGSTLRLYVDGAEVGSRAVTGPVATSASPVRIGSAGTAGQYFNGLIDEVRIFEQARTPAQITQDMATPVTP